MKHILIVNQHGENRGDEAAMRAMLAALSSRLGDVEFTLLYQFRDRSLRLSFREQVTDYPILMSPLAGLSLAAFGAAKRAHLPAFKAALSSVPKGIVEAYERADLVVSAPGGPYFGDIYADHELVHWFFVWLASVYKTPVALYATSAGPFENKLLNPLRRHLYKKFDLVCVREELSAQHLRELLGPDIDVVVTADSAIQQSFEPYPREEIFTGERAALKDRFLVATSLNDYKYPGDPDPAGKKQAYEEAMLGLLRHLAQRRDCHFLMLPQLYGKAHSDVPFLEKMGRRLPTDVSWEVVDPDLDSDGQRRIFATADVHVASRYHPAIFGNTGLTPGLCIYYEHKALGFMQQLGLERYAFDIRALDEAELCRAMDTLLEERDALVEHLKENVPRLQATSGRTSDLVVELLRPAAA